MGATVRVVGVVGDDENGKHVRAQLMECGADPGTLVVDPHRPTTSKVRLVGLAQHRHPQQMMRLDFEDLTAPGVDVGGRVLATLERVLDEADMLCIEDYNK